MSLLWKLGVKATFLGCVGFTFQQYFVSPWLLEENSMEPSLKDGEIVLATPRTNSLTRGDIVIVKHPQNPAERVCKRVIALPGDEVAYKKNFIQVPDGQMWLEGDNKTESWDSRDYGPVPIGLLEGVVLLKLFPLKWMRKPDVLRVNEE